MGHERRTHFGAQRIGPPWGRPGYAKLRS